MNSAWLNRIKPINKKRRKGFKSFSVNTTNCGKNYKKLQNIAVKCSKNAINFKKKTIFWGKNCPIASSYIMKVKIFSWSCLNQMKRSERSLQKYTALIQSSKTLEKAKISHRQVMLRKKTKLEYKSILSLRIMQPYYRMKIWSSETSWINYENKRKSYWMIVLLWNKRLLP